MKTITPLLLLAASIAQADDCNYVPSPPDAERATGKVNVAQAWFAGSTTRYAHGVLGDTIEAETLYVLPQGSKQCALSVTLESHSVFEDLTPRIADVTGDGLDNIIAIESHEAYGAALTIYGIEKGELIKLAATPYIGTRYRWLAPVGSADFDDDGIDDVAYVETPHLAGVIKIWSFAEALPKLLASKPGFSNHRIGENFITGGIAACDGKPTIIVPDRNWTKISAVHHENGVLVATTITDSTDETTINNLLTCQ